MNELFKAVKISDKVYWVGANDWGLRDFHGYNTSRGSSYNAYLILDKKPTLIDVVKKPFKKELMSRIASVIDPKEIAYIISNHSEMDHSGALPEIIAEIKPEKVFASKMGEKALREHYHFGDAVTAVKDGEKLNIGEETLLFVETRMLHWPDSMFTYMDGAGILFSQDAFGMHLASSARFADEIPQDVLDYEAAKYYANILLPYSPLVLKLGDKIAKAGLKFNMIAPDHGPIWRSRPERIIEKYIEWANQKPTNKALVAYDSMWGSTELMARAVAEGLAEGGATPTLMPLKASHRSDIATELLTSSIFMVGSPTMNNSLYPTVADMLYYIKGLKKKGLTGGAFGSYGWSGDAIRELKPLLEEMKLEYVGDVECRYVPEGETLKRCYELGKKAIETHNLKKEE